MIPISSNQFPTFLSIGAAADTIILNLPPKLSYISLNTFFLMSIPAPFNAFVTDIIVFTILSFLLFTIFSFIFLYKLSTNNGTVKIAVGCASCKFGTMYLKPSHIATDAPVAIGSKNPIVDS